MGDEITVQISEGETIQVSTRDQHTRYTDEEAVAALSEVDKYLLNTGDAIAGDLTLDTGEVAIDHSAKEVPQSFLGGPASSLTAYPIPESDLADNYYTTTEADSAFVDASGDSMSGNLSLGGNYIKDVFGINLGQDISATDNFVQLKTNGADGAGTIYVTDDYNGQYLAEFNEGGSVKFPNGGLTVHGITLPTGDIHAGSSYPKLRTQGDTGGNGWVIYDEYNAKNILVGKEGGNVDIPNGNVNVGASNYISFGGVNSIRRSGGNLYSYTRGGSVKVWDTTNGQDVVRFNEGGDVEIPNGSLKVSTEVIDSSNANFGIALNSPSDTSLVVDDGAGSQITALSALGGGNVKIPNGKLIFSGGRIDDVNRIYGGTTNGSEYIEWRKGSLKLGLNASGAAVNLYDQYNSQAILSAKEGGDVEIPNGDLHLSNGNYLHFPDSGGTVRDVLTLNSNDEVVLSVDNTSGGHLVLDGRDADHQLRLTSDSKLQHINWGGMKTLELDSGGHFSIPHGPITQGKNPAEVINETGTPTSFTFTGSEHRDIHVRESLDFTNGSSSSVTEDVTVDLYDGSDSTGTLVASQTKSVTVSANTTKTGIWFNNHEISIDDGTYYVEVTTSGTTLTVDKTEEQTKGASYEYGQDQHGNLTVTNHDGEDVVQIDSVTNNINFAGKKVTVGQLGDVAEFNSDKGHKFTSSHSGDFVVHLNDGGYPEQLRVTYRGKVEIPNGNLQMGGNLIQETRAVRAPSATQIDIQSNGAPVKVHDSTNSQAIAWFYEGGNVDIPNGNLHIGTADGSHTLKVARHDTTSNKSFIETATGSTGLRIRPHNGTSYITGIDITSGGNVEVPNGGLRVKGTHGGGDALAIAGDLKFTDTTSYIQSGGSGSDAVILYDSANGQNLIEAHEGGNVEIPNGNIFANANLTLGTGHSTPRLAFQNTGSEKMRFDLLSNDLVLYDKVNALEVIRAKQGGNVEIPSGNLQLADGNRIENNSDTQNAQEFKSHTSVGDTAKVQLLSTASETGKVLVVNRTAGSSAEFYLDGVNGHAQEINDPDGAFSTMETGAGTTNIYWDSTNARFELENLSGSTSDYSVHLLT